VRAIDDKSQQLRHELIGQSAEAIATMASIARPYLVRLLVIPTEPTAPDHFYAGEKLAPVLSIFTVSGEDGGLRLSRALVKGAGAGHTAIIHSANLAARGALRPPHASRADSRECCRRARMMPDDDRARLLYDARLRYIRRHILD
jgi:acyl-CoA reductase-like NAD-dependent aldehyde dehydrogenase